MTATAPHIAAGEATAPRLAPWFALGGLGLAVMVRAVLLRSPFLPDGLDGIVFAAVLLATATGTAALLGAGHALTPRTTRHALPSRIAPTEAPLSGRRSLVVGIFGGVVLVAVPLGLRMVGPLGGPVSPARGIGVGFELWVVVTLVVAISEELLLRGALFGAASRSLGMVATLLLTSAVFALMHVPFYGWGVVPLDFAVGLWLGGLRLVTGRVSAPAAAHVIADLAAWWL